MIHNISFRQSNMAEDGKEQSESKDRSVVSQKVLFVRNLPFSATDQDLENIFSEVGPIKRCFVIRDKGKKPVLGLIYRHVHVYCMLEIQSLFRSFSTLLPFTYKEEKSFSKTRYLDVGHR